MVQPISKASISYADARTCVEAAYESARNIGVPMAIAVVDDSGILKAFVRMDGAALLAIQVAQDKAYTSCWLRSFDRRTDAMVRFY
jgi:uncharacterized protein GlcG (DUF336 family)